MQKIASYNVVAASNYAELSKEINERIKQGWQPYGSLSTQSTVLENKLPKIHTNFFQAIVIYEQ